MISFRRSVLLLALSVEILGAAQGVDYSLHCVGGDDLVAVSPFGEEFCDSGFYLGEYLVAVGVSSVVRSKTVQIILHQLMCVLVQSERYVSYTDFNNLLHFYKF